MTWRYYPSDRPELVEQVGPGLTCKPHPEAYIDSSSWSEPASQCLPEAAAGSDRKGPLLRCGASYHTLPPANSDMSCDQAHINRCWEQARLWGAAWCRWVRVPATRPYPDRLFRCGLQRKERLTAAGRCMTSRLGLTIGTTFQPTKTIDPDRG